MSAIAEKDIISCLPLLASVLGDRYGVHVKVGHSNACTNGETIFLPPLPTTGSPELVGMVRGLIDHEAGHIRETTFSALRDGSLDPLTKWLANAIEGWRIEQRMAAIYPGCKANLAWLIRKFFVEDAKDESSGTQEAGNTNPAFFVLDYVLLTVRTWDVPEVAPNRDKARCTVESAFPGLAADIDSVLLCARHNCPNTVASIAYACEIVKKIRQWKPPVEKPQQNEDGSRQETAEKSQPSTAAPSPEKDKEQREQQRATDKPDTAAAHEGGESNAAGSSAGTDKAPVSNPREKLNSFLASSEDALPKGLGEQVAEKVETMASDEGSFSSVSIAGESPREAQLLSNTEVQSCLRESIALRCRLQGLLQAQSLARRAIGRSGRLSTRHLARLGVSDPRVFQRDCTTKAVDTAVHILLDASGSMKGPRIELARRACFCTLNALSDMKKVNPALTVFPGGDMGNSVAPILRHGARLNTSLDIEPSGRTPLAPALWWTMRQMVSLKEQRKIILVITDGAPDTVTPCIEAIAYAAKLGAEVFGIGVQCAEIKNIMPAEKCRVIIDLKELTPSLFEMLQAELLNQ